jgi:hypothetical protein
MELKLQYLLNTDEDWAIRVCILVEQAQWISPGSIQKACEDCGRPIWYDPNQPVPTIPGVFFKGEVSLCFQCAELYMAADPNPTKWI